MNYISYRKNFWSNVDIGVPDAIREVPNDGTSAETPISDDDFRTSIKNQRLLLLIHGYRNKRENIIGGYSMIDGAMQAKNIVGTGARAYHQVIGIAWPGGFTRASYLLAKMRANALGDSVFARLKKIVEAAKAVDIMTHSLGARVVLKALQNAAPDSETVRNLFLTAPAVDDESIQEGEKFFISTQACRKVYVLHSSNDKVLKLSYPLMDFDKALGLNGPDKPNKVGGNVQLVDCSNAIKAHSDYRKRLELYSFIKKVLDGQPTPDQLPTDEGFVPGAVATDPDDEKE
jgi:esterase/lipase superfamily enzyme